MLFQGSSTAHPGSRNTLQTWAYPGTSLPPSTVRRTVCLRPPSNGTKTANQCDLPRPATACYSPQEPCSSWGWPTDARSRTPACTGVWPETPLGSPAVRTPPFKLQVSGHYWCQWQCNNRSTYHYTHVTCYRTEQIQDYQWCIQNYFDQKCWFWNIL